MVAIGVPETPTGSEQKNPNTRGGIDLGKVVKGLMRALGNLNGMSSVGPDVRSALPPDNPPSAETPAGKKATAQPISQGK